MRDKLLTSQPSTLPEHELLELLLYYSIPRRNTNELAHLLLQKYGSIKEIINTPSSELMNFHQIGENTVAHLSLLREIFQGYSSEPYHRQRLDTIKKIEEYLRWKTDGELCESVYLLMLDKTLAPIECRRMADGGDMSVSANKKACFSAAFDAKAAYVVLAHNHPSGVAAPSSEDRAVSLSLQSGFNLLGIELIDHFIFCGDKVIQVLNNSDIF